MPTLLQLSKVGQPLLYQIIHYRGQSEYLANVCYRQHLWLTIEVGTLLLYFVVDRSVIVNKNQKRY